MPLTLVIPARNEARYLPLVLRTVHKALPHDALLVLSDSGSHDETEAVVVRLQQDLPRLQYVRVAEPGKGLAIRTAWQAHPNHVLAFMDADLSTDLEALPRLLAAAESADIVIGSRRHRDSIVSRSRFRQFISWVFFRALRFHFPETAIGDTTCGFKGVRREAFERLSSRVSNQHFFFDTELLLHAQASGLRILELPIRWREEALPGRRTSVRILRVAREYLAGLRRMKAFLGVRAS